LPESLDRIAGSDETVTLIALYREIHLCVEYDADERKKKIKTRAREGEGRVGTKRSRICGEEIKGETR
jgi:hypothetical protein